MAVVPEPRYVPLDAAPDADPARRASLRAMVMDPVAPDGHYVRDLVLFFQRLAPGVGHARHWHTCDEALVVDAGRAEVTLGEARHTLGAGAVAFVPAGAPHNVRNAGAEVLRFHVIFLASVVGSQPLVGRPTGAGDTIEAAKGSPYLQDLRA
jgi:mannose-6-phosphate isomerase-like protein (cupin superfamily)